MGLSHSRISQLVREARRVTVGHRFRTPAIDRLFATIHSRIPCLELDANELFADLLGSSLSLQGAEAFAQEILGRRPPWRREESKDGAITLVTTTYHRRSSDPLTDSIHNLVLSDRLLVERFIQRLADPTTPPTKQAMAAPSTQVEPQVRVRERRLDAGLTQHQLADAIGISRDALAQYERRRPQGSFNDPRTFIRAARVFGTTVEELFGYVPSESSLEQLILARIAALGRGELKSLLTLLDCLEYHRSGKASRTKS